MKLDPDGRGKLLLWIITTVMLSNYTETTQQAAVLAIVLLVLGWFAIKLAFRTSAAQGSAGWGLLAQLAFWFVLFLFFYPAGLDAKILLIWAVGFPLAITAGIYRQLSARYPKLHLPAEAVWQTLGVFILLGAFSGWMRDDGFFSTLFAGATATVLGSIPVYYGWMLGTPRPRPDNDARFGDPGDF